VAIEKGFYEELGLEVKAFPGGPGINPLRRVLNDKKPSFGGYYNWFVLQIRQRMSVDLRVVATDFQSPALHLVSWIPINKPEDILNEVVEVWPGYGYPLKTFLGKERKKKLIKNQPGNVKQFFLKRRTATHAMVYNELLDVKKHFDLDEIKPDKNEYKTKDGEYIYIYRYGQLDPALAWDENSLVTQGKTIENSPGLVKKFVNATYKGWKWAMTHDADKVVDILLQYNDGLEREKEKTGGKRIHEIMIDKNTCEHGLGYINPKPWPDMSKTLFEAGLIDSMPSEKEIKAAYHYVPSDVYPPASMCKE